MFAEKRSILFVCTANRYRSPFAEFVFRKKLLDTGITWYISSAGTWTENNLPAIPDAVQKAKALGLDLSEHRSIEVTETLLLEHDLVLVMEKGHKEALWAEFPVARQRIFLLAEVVDGVAYDIPDPARFRAESEMIMNDLHGLIERGYEKILQKATSLSQNAAA